VVTHEATILQRILNGPLGRKALADVAKERHQERKAAAGRISELEAARDREMPRQL
jgi:hypothetical protein